MFEWESQYFDKRYASGRNSGAGSEAGAVRHKVELISGLPEVEKVLEIGCGDFNFGKALMEKLPQRAEYMGLDISKVIIDRNLAEHENARIQFSHIAGLPKTPMQTDLLLCLDVLFHVRDLGEYYAMLAWLRSVSWKYLAVTAYEYSGPSDDHLRIRKFNPNHFGEPIVREVIEEDGQMYLYVYKR